MNRRDHRAPGIYTERSSSRRNPISLGETGVPAFLGVATRGPVDVPVLVTSYDSYYKTFGPPVEHSYLPDAVYGFFSNGGRNCFVLRIAHRSGPDGQRAAAAYLDVLDSSGQPTLRIEASSEGAWGNDVEVELQLPKSTVQTYLTFDAEKGQKHVKVKSARGFERGSLVKIYSGETAHYAVLSEVRSKLLRLRDDEALPVALKSSDLVYVEPVEFEVLVRMGGKRERLAGLSLAPTSERFPERFVSEQSDLVRVTVYPSDRPVAERLPVATPPGLLKGGADGLAGITPNDFIGMNDGPAYRVGLASLEANEEIDLLAVPDLMMCLDHSDGFKGKRDIETVQEAVLSHCEKMRDRLAILDVPPNMDPEKAMAWRLQFDSAFGAFYYPWVAAISKDAKRLVPPSGHIAGVFARSDREAGPHRAAANEVIQGAVHLQVALDEEQVGQLNAVQLNPIRVVPARGIRVWGARTTASRREWRYVPVRRVFNAVRRAIYHGTQWVAFENNDDDLWRTVTRQLKVFLQGLFDKGYFAGENPDQAFYIKCDAETNPPEGIAAGELVALIGIAPVRPAEYITFTLEQQLPEQG